MADSAYDYRHGLNKAFIRYNIICYKADIEYNKVNNTDFVYNDNI